jgi:hypothetical protein
VAGGGVTDGRADLDGGGGALAVHALGAQPAALGEPAGLPSGLNQIAVLHFWDAVWLYMDQPRGLHGNSRRSCVTG